MHRSDRVRWREIVILDLVLIIFQCYPGVSPDRFYLSFHLLRSTLPLCPSSIVNFNFTSIPPPLALFCYFLFLFRIFHTCVCIVTPPFVPTCGKLKFTIFSRQSADGALRPVIIANLFVSSSRSKLWINRTSSPSRIQDIYIFYDIDLCRLAVAD